VNPVLPRARGSKTPPIDKPRTVRADEHAVLSPAKVNLFLKVLSRRPDGYHDLVSVVDIISLYDRMWFEPDRGGNITVIDDKGLLPSGLDNTVYKAAMLLKEAFGIDEGAKVFVEKHIPIGSGLGGPSSNGATALRGLAGMWDLAISEEELASLGRRIGADVPLFLYGKPCVMRGVGDKISPIGLPKIWYLIIYPDTVIRTREVYEGLRIVLTKQENDIKLRGNFDTTLDVAGILENDLEKVAILMCPTIKSIKDRLIEAGSIGALMSGSGSSVFGVFETEARAEAARRLVNNMGTIFLAHSV
jgi:4-diphosphocytidyl-2-C-methyl-D-erythritol kinase